MAFNKAPFNDFGKKNYTKVNLILYQNNSLIFINYGKKNQQKKYLEKFKD